MINSHGIRTWLLLALATTTWFVVSVSGQNITTQKKTERDLIRHLFSDYDNRSRPVKDPAKRVHVSVDFSLVSIADLNEKDEKLTTYGWLSLIWKDEYLVWDKAQWSGMERVVIPGYLVWFPDVVIRNSAKKLRGDVMDEGKNYRYILYHNGTINAWTAGEMTTFCAIDVTYFPFDDQACYIGIDSWMYSITELEMNSRHDKIQMNLYEKSCQWALLDTNVRRTLDIYDEDDDVVTFSNLKLEFYLRRKPLYYVYNIILPSVLLSLLVLLIFLLPADAGEKVSLGVTILLSFTVFQLVIADSLPKSSDHMPVIVMYILSTMGMTTVSLVMAVVVLALHHRSDECSPPSPWLRKIILFVAKTVRVQTSLRSRYSNNVTTSRSVKSEIPQLLGNDRSSPEACGDGINGPVHSSSLESTSSASHKSDWIEVARIADRGLFVIFLVVIIVSTAVMVGIYPLTKPALPKLSYN